MKNYMNIILFITISTAVADRLTCTSRVNETFELWKDMVDPCIKLMQEQIDKEIQASTNYLSMAIHFSRDTVNRPGFSAFFLQSAKEEREHAIKFMEYLLMRGQLTQELAEIVEVALIPTTETWESPLEALRYALKMETNVTKSIQNIITECEQSSTPNNTFNDYHLVDYLTTEFLEEQYKGQRDLAGKISTLGKLMKTQGHLGEFLFDKKSLKLEL